MTCVNARRAFSYCDSPAPSSASAEEGFVTPPPRPFAGSPSSGLDDKTSQQLELEAKIAAVQTLASVSHTIGLSITGLILAPL